MPVERCGGTNSFPLIGNQFPEKKPQEIKILDVGTGPGFFAILACRSRVSGYCN